MGRWYRIGLDPKKPTAAAMVAADAGAAGRLWQDPQSQAIADTILIDIINMTSDQDLRFKAMYAYMGLHQVDPLERSHGKKVINSPTAIKLITEKLLDPQGGDEWSRVYYFALVISALVDDPPITYEQIKEDVHDDEGRQNDLQKIGKWYRIHKADLEKAALEEGIELEKIRALLRDGK